MTIFKIALLMPMAKLNKWLRATKFMLNSEERNFVKFATDNKMCSTSNIGYGNKTIKE
jgi:hypothetical protein